MYLFTLRVGVPMWIGGEETRNLSPLFFLQFLQTWVSEHVNGQKKKKIVFMK